MALPGKISDNSGVVLEVINGSSEQTPVWLASSDPITGNISTGNIIGITRIVLTMKLGGVTTTIDSSVSPSSFDWVSRASERVALVSLGQYGLSDGRYKCHLQVFDPSNTNGVMWGDFFTITVKTL